MDKYDRQHRRNLSAYEKEIDKLYRQIVTQFALLGASLSLSDDSLFSFDDYPQLKKRVEALFESLSAGMSSVIVNGIRSEWALANDKNDELARQIFGDNVGNLTQEQYRRYFSNNADALEAFLNRKKNGLGLSDYVWKYTNQFKNEIELGLEVGIRNGMSADKMSQELRQYLKYPDKLFRRVKDEHGNLQLSKAAKAFHPGQGVYRSSYKNARRLAATETNIAYMSADYERWQQLDFVVGIEIRLSNNHTLNGEPFTDICDELKGEYPKDFKFTGWHPHCRCHAISILKTDEEREEDTRKFLNGEPIDGESVNRVKDVPENFKKWIRDNESRYNDAANRGTLPYFIKDNQEIVGGILQGMQEVSRGVPSLADIRKEYSLQLTDESDYTDGIAAKFAFLEFKQQLQNIAQKHKIELDRFDLNIKDKKNFNFSITGTGFDLERTFFVREAGNIEVHHDFFALDEKYQGQGVSKEVLRLLYSQYQNMGVRYLSVTANLDVGGYTWARYGFWATRKSEALSAIRYCPNAAIREEAIELVNKYYTENSLADSDPFPMRLLTEQPWGRKLLLKSFWEGILDLQNKEMRKGYTSYLGI